MTSYSVLAVPHQIQAYVIELPEHEHIRNAAVDTVPYNTPRVIRTATYPSLATLRACSLVCHSRPVKSTATMIFEK